MIAGSPFLALFVPGNRPERFAKAASSGADAIVIDLEDAVPPSERSSARDAVLTALRACERPPCEVCVRLNSSGTDDFVLDLALMEQLPEWAGLMLAKAETADEMDFVGNRLPGRFRIALIETSLGLSNARSLASLSDRLAFGSIDFANSIGAAHLDVPLLAARSELVLASALAGCPGPLDGVTTSIRDRDLITKEAARSRELGFRGKLLIHPGQVAPALQGMAPRGEAVEEARRVLASVGESTSGFEGKMVDAPVLLAARRLIEEDDAIGKRLSALAAI